MARCPTGLLEEGLKNKVAADWFAAYDTTRIIGKVDWEGESVYVRFTVREGCSRAGQSELYGTMVSRIAVYKAKGAVLSDPSHVHGESSMPFVDIKLVLFLSAVKGDAENDKNGQTGFVISAEARAVLDAEGYNERFAALKAAMKDLAAKIQPKIYEYGFLRK